MVKYILKRLVYVVFVFFIVSILMFGIYKMVPGDPARMMLDTTKATTDPEKYRCYRHGRSSDEKYRYLECSVVGVGVCHNDTAGYLDGGA